MHEYQTSLPRAVLALVVGSFVGAGLVTFWLLASAADVQYLLRYGVHNGLVIFLYAIVIWTAGLVVVAPLPWIVLHRLHQRNWWTAVALGAGLSFIITFALLTNWFGLSVEGNLSASDAGGPTWVDGRLTAHGWMNAFRAALLCAAAGALVGLAVWRTAYYRVQP